MIGLFLNNTQGIRCKFKALNDNFYFQIEKLEIQILKFQSSFDPLKLF